MTTAAWFNCSSGIAGDMALGALIDAGASIHAINEQLQGLPVNGWELRAERVTRASLAATKAHVHAPELDHHRHLTDITAIIGAASFPNRVTTRSIAVFSELAAAEAAVHGVSIDEVHFHEVGALDAIIDIVGTCIALELLQIDAVGTSSIAVGTGTVTAAHGLLPNPVPAVVRLLVNRATHGVDTPRELTTPTGAAIIAALSERSGPMPPMTITSSGFGAGSSDDPTRPNVTQVVIGTLQTPNLGNDAQDLLQVETNLDDVTPETLAYTVSCLLQLGVHDAWITPIVMKKGRPAFTLHVLCPPSMLAEVRGVITSETGTFGVRAATYQRWPEPRMAFVVNVDGHRIGIKVSSSRMKAEHDDVAAAATALGRPLRTVRDEAEQLARDQPNQLPRDHPHQLGPDHPHASDS